jgi:phospholipase C
MVAVPNTVAGCRSRAAIYRACRTSQRRRWYAVCDHWFGSVPTETLPNRAFALAASQGHMDNKTRIFLSPSIFGSLTNAGRRWSAYGYDAQPTVAAPRTAQKALAFIHPA